MGVFSEHSVQMLKVIIINLNNIFVNST